MRQEDATAAFNERWETWALEANRRGLRIACWLAGTIHPAFAILDYLTVPARWLSYFYSLRLGATLFVAAHLFVARTRWFGRHYTAITAIFFVVLAASVAAMIPFIGGFSSPYYAGLNLITLGAAVLFVWPTHVSFLANLAVILLYVVPNAIVSDGSDARAAVTNLFFLGSIAAVGVASQGLRYRMMQQQVRDQVALELIKQTLEEANEKLKQLDRFKSQFFANITHELKTPLALILSPLELLLEGQLGELSEVQQRTLRTMYRHGVKLMRLVGDLLDLSRLQESRLKLAVRSVDLRAFVEDLVAQVRPFVERKGVELRLVASETGEFEVWIDPHRMERVVLNLLSNAAKFTPPGGHIEVRLIDEGDEGLRLEVADTGPGFPPEMAERVFERFFQVDMDSTRRHGGAGIGLALARELIELHGGTLRARSAPGEGATFELRLRRGAAHLPPEFLERGTAAQTGHVSPDMDAFAEQWRNLEDFRLLDIEEATERRIVERDEDEALRSATVLVVEDTPDILQLIHQTLRHDFRVLAATNGRQGLELARRMMPDVVVTDLMMPEMDGLEMTQHLQEDARTRTIPVIMLTARADVEDRIRGLEHGAAAYIGKPFSPRELLSTVRGLVRKRHETTELVLDDRLDALERVAASLAHEINNPLNYIRNSLDLLARDIPALAKESGHEKKARRMLRLFDAARAGAEQIGHIVELMRRYGREGYARAPEDYDVFEGLRDVVQLVERMHRDQVHVEFETEGRGVVHCVPQEIHQVLTNLVQNACEACPKDGTGRVWVRGWREGSWVVVEVADNGPGIAPEHRQRIFNPFFSTKGSGGMGLGLAIVQRIVRAHGGSIEVGGAPGEGAVFTVRLPVAARDGARRGPGGSAGTRLREHDAAVHG